MRSLFLIATTAVSIGVWSSAFSQQSLGTKTGSDLHARTAIYPDGMACGRITSFFGSMIDLDGTRRKMAHTGIDLGNLGVPSRMITFPLVASPFSWQDRF